ncbi:4Fe-4S dicluster domain-containing protein [Vibrio sp. FNV 38]|nr:4Fe-4S dicluster domain-containing protein [Vibrio sp. FNV 38]
MNKMMITEKCIGCFACANVCPQNAIVFDEETTPSFRIHEKRCNECVGVFAHRQCGEICPVEQAITVNGRAINPANSLSPSVVPCAV